MIDFIKGKLSHVFGDAVVVENQGIGYRVMTSTGSIADFSMPGDEIIIYTEMIVREDAISLVGFSTRDELNMFQLLTSVSGVGPKVGIGILSSMPYGHVASAIASQDLKALQNAQGVGKKTAERIVLELKDKVPQTLSLQAHEHVQTSTNESQGNYKDALDALLSLGYTRSEAQGVLKQVDIESMTIEEIIKTALKKLMF